MSGLRVEAATQDKLDWLAETEARIHDYPWTRGQFADSFRGGHPIWLLFDGETQLAYAVTMPLVDEIELLNIGVVPERRRSGLGRALLQFVVAEARARTLQKLFLEVRESNHAARQLYEDAGFAVVGRRYNYYPAPGGREDAIIMAKQL